MAGYITAFLILLFSFSLSLTAGEAVSPLKIQPETFEMKPVKEGEAAEAVLFIRNEGSDFMEIVDVQSSCGCTAAEPESRLIPGGGFTRLKISVDTSAKLGDVKKWVRVRDAKGNEATAWLTLNVADNPHMSGEGKGIFSEGCRSCHYTPAVGLHDGEALYQAACAMCHGADAKGDYAPGLRHHNDLEALSYLIREGTGGRQMPGFGLEQGGPLSKDQVDALSRWLLSLD